MNRILSALAAGMVFGSGIAISGMGNPAKVLNFFDPFGTWDPSLVFVMGGALLTTMIGYRLLFRGRQTPLFDEKFHVPTARDLDVKLIGGAALFGIGWGVAGFCPGGAVPALGFAPWPTALFLIAMGGGILLARWLQAIASRKIA